MGRRGKKFRQRHKEKRRERSEKRWKEKERMTKHLKAESIQIFTWHQDVRSLAVSGVCGYEGVRVCEWVCEWVVWVCGMGRCVTNY